MEIVTKKDAFLTEEEPEIKAKRIFKYYIAKGLIARGHRVVDIKPDVDNRDRVVFLFEDSLDLRDDMQIIIKAHRKALAEKENTIEEE